MACTAFNILLGNDETSQEFTIPKGRLTAKKDKFTCSNVRLQNGGAASAVFNFKKCTFTMTIKKTDIEIGQGEANLGFEFADFSENTDTELP